MADVRFSTEFEKDLAIVSIGGEVYSPDVPVFDERLEEIIEKTSKIILDFSKLYYLCSAGIGCLIGYFNQARHNGGKIVIARINEKLFKVLERIGFPGIIEITDSIEEAKTLFTDM